MSNDLHVIKYWFLKSKMILNVEKTENFSLKEKNDLISKIKYPFTSCMCTK